MIEYLPWSRQVLEENISLHKNGIIPTLELELSSICTDANCIYCDSKPFVGPKMKNELSKKELLDLLRNAKDNGLKWVYTCGLGEPLEDDKFWSMLDFLQKNNIKISLFTNEKNIRASRYIASRHRSRDINFDGTYLISLTLCFIADIQSLAVIRLLGMYFKTSPRLSKANVHNSGVTYFLGTFARFVPHDFTAC
jgi:hypothetical protein